MSEKEGAFIHWKYLIWSRFIGQDPVRKSQTNPCKALSGPKEQFIIKVMEWLKEHKEDAGGAQKSGAPTTQAGSHDAKFVVDASRGMY